MSKKNQLNYKKTCFEDALQKLENNLKNDHGLVIKIVDNHFYGWLDNCTYQAASKARLLSQVLTELDTIYG